jgi:hypothetical protein
MKTLIVSILCFLCFAASVAIFGQTNSTVLCKDQPIPDGFVISGETISVSCKGTSAWVIKPKRSARPAELDRFTVATANDSREPVEAIAPGQCDQFQLTIRNTYNFNPALMDAGQVKAQSAKLDVFWNQVRQSRTTLLPCLRKALKEDNSSSFFAIDGSMLLVDIDPSRASKALQVKKFISANLDGVDLAYWVRTMARRGVEGFDTSEAGAKWLSYPKAKYHLSMHGGYPVNSFIGAVFIFGSMDEEFATPVLLRLVNEVGRPRDQRESALAILESQATHASLQALRQVNASGLTPGTAESIRELLDNPKLLKPRAHPKLTREEQLNAFQGIVNGDYSAFRAMVMKAPDGEVDAVAMLRPEDIPLVRQARRASISRCNQHAIADYASFTQILWALTWKAEAGR